MRAPHVFAALALASTLTTGNVAAPASAAQTTRAVTYGGVTVQVPRAWPVYDLAAAPQTCVRYDQNAVYLGQAGTDQDCPAHAVGRTDTLRIEPDNAPAVRSRARAAFPEPGLGQSVTRRVAHMQVTATYSDDDRQAATIIDSAAVTDRDATSTVPSTRSLTVEEAGLAGAELGAAVPAAPAAVKGALTVKPAVTVKQGHATFNGAGFDACAAPSIQTMGAWAESSGYQAAGIYIGGEDRACPDGNLTPDWIRLAAGQGWQLFPIYVGRQAPCWYDRVSGKALRIDPAGSSDEGGAAADGAADRARHFGLAAGSPIYFDMEAYPRSNLICSQAVKAFLTAWTTELHTRGFLSGVYSSTSAAIADLADSYDIFSADRPDAVWFAHWDAQPALFGDMTLPDRLWRGHQRIKQFSGGHTESFGGRKLTIDSDVLDAPVAVVGSPLAPLAAYAPGLVFDRGDGTSTLYSWSSEGSSFPGPGVSGPYDIDAGKVGDRVVAGAFSAVGASDLATIEVGAEVGVGAGAGAGHTTVIRVYRGGGRPGGSFAPTGTVWWSGTIPGAATARIAAGDFDGDGRCDLAALVDPGNGAGVRVYRWLSTGTALTAPTLWQAAAAWPGSRLAERIAAGRFTDPGHADLAVATQNPDGTMDIRVLAAAAGLPDGTPGPVWYHGGSFDLGRAGGRMVAGRFLGGVGSGRDGLAMLYDRGSGNATLFRWDATGSAFGTPAVWNGRYDATAVGPRLAAADITGTGIADVVAAAQRPNGTFALHVWDRGSSYAGDDGWYVSGIFPLVCVGGRMVML